MSRLKQCSQIIQESPEELNNAHVQTNFINISRNGVQVLVLHETLAGQFQGAAKVKNCCSGPVPHFTGGATKV